MKIRDKLVRRSAQEIIADFPPMVAIDGEQFGMDGVIVVKPGEVGYYRSQYVIGKSLEEVDALHGRVFGIRAPSDAEREAAAIGSIAGWGVPGADPMNYLQREAG